MRVITGILLLSYSLNSQVGIGTTTPTVELDIESSASTTYIDINNTAADGDPGINFQLGGVTTFSLGIDDGDADMFKIGTSAMGTSTRMSITSAGYVGIGSQTPYTGIQLFSTADAQDDGTIDKYALVITNPANDTGEEIGIGFRTSASYDNSYVPGAAITFERTAANSVGDLHFKTAPSNGQLDTRMTVDQDGKIGIGTTSPGATIDVDGDAIFNESGADKDFRVEGDTDTDLFKIDASSDMVGIGEASPGAKLEISEVNGVAYHLEALRLTHDKYWADQSVNIAFHHSSGEQARIRSKLYTSATESDIQFWTNTGGTLTQSVTVYDNKLGVNIAAPTAALDVDGDAIFNESGGSKDFRIEGDTDVNLVFVDGSADKVGVGTASPSRTLDINGDLQIATLANKSVSDGQAFKTLVVDASGNVDQWTTMPYGVNVQSAVGTTDISLGTEATWTDMTDMTITYTPYHSTVYVTASVAGFYTGDDSGYIAMRIVKDGVSQFGTNTVLGDYDDTVAAGEEWNLNITYPISVTAGTSVTIKVQWYYVDDADNATPIIQPTTWPAFNHRHLFILD